MRRPGSTEWAKLGARWLSQACHRSLYGYQLRTAFALAVENPHAAVTFLPLACTGATIETGLLNRHACTRDQLRGRPLPDQRAGTDRAAAAATAAARRTIKDRTLDLVLLTVGANDIDFSGLVANVIIDAGTERALVGRSVISSVEDAEAALRSQAAARLRAPARRAQALARRRPLARGVRLVRQSDPARRRHALQRRPRRLRRASGLPARRGTHAAGRELRRDALPPDAEGDRAMHRRHAVPGPERRPHDLRRCASGRVRGPRDVRALRAGPRIRPRVLRSGRQILRDEPGRGRDRAGRMRPAGARVPRLCAARALDPHRER